MMPTFLAIYEKLEHLVQRLPEGLRQPILREITPIKTLFLLQRPPRIVLLGERDVSRTAFVNALFAAPVAKDGEDHVQHASWQNFANGGRGTLRLLDARRPAQLPSLSRALSAEAPDLFIFVREGAPGSNGAGSDLDQAREIIEFADRSHDVRAKILGVTPKSEVVETLEVLFRRDELAGRMAGMGVIADATHLSELIALELPSEAQLEMARLSGNRVLQSQIAHVLIKSVTAICGAVAAQPIPLADFPILTSLQAAMVASIAHVSGRELSFKATGEFLAALGANIGMGLALREGARAAAKLVPVWGSAISGAVAAAGTYGLGRAAVAYFIEGLSIKDARAAFRKKKETPLLK